MKFTIPKNIYIPTAIFFYLNIVFIHLTSIQNDDKIKQKYILYILGRTNR